MLKLMTIFSGGLIAMGGWAVVTVKDVPEYLVAGRQYTIEFQVRQHGRKLLNGLQPELVIRPSAAGGGGGGAKTQTIKAVPRSDDGSYAVTFTAPTARQVFLTIHSGWGNSELNLYPQPVVAAGTPVGQLPRALSPVDRGQILFVSKGCTICHANSDLAAGADNMHLQIGPELGGRRLTREYVIQKIKNPASEKMPDLGLGDADINAIAAFLTGERTAATGR